MKGSRTYKLRLSEEGIDLFLQCHCRLAHLVRDFIPYGMTLAVALTILDKQDPCEIAAELETRRCRQALGTYVRMVGSSGELVEKARRISEKLVNSAELPVAPQLGILYIAALGTLAAAEDDHIVDAARRTHRSRAEN